MPKKTVDEKIDELALMVGRGFNELRQDMNKRFDDVEKRLDRIEFVVNGQERRIEIAEDRIRQLAVKVGIVFN